MKKPVDQPDRAHLIHRSVLLGDYQLNGTLFKYNQDDAKPNLAIAQLAIRAGENCNFRPKWRGKSTLLQLLSGMQMPQQGNIYLDGLDLSLIDPADIRRDTGLLNQSAHLFYGTIRENLTLGAPLASDDDLIQALKMTGAWSFVQDKKKVLIILYLRVA